MNGRERIQQVAGGARQPASPCDNHHCTQRRSVSTDLVQNSSAMTGDGKKLVGRIYLRRSSKANPHPAHSPSAEIRETRVHPRQFRPNAARDCSNPLFILLQAARVVNRGYNMRGILACVSVATL